jgi:dihydrofolate reductase
MPPLRKVILYIASSLDGYIAEPGGDLSFLSPFTHKGEDYGYSEFIKNIDTVIMGRKTYDWVMKQVKVFPHSDIDSYIITHEPGKGFGKVRFYSGRLKELLSTLKKEKGNNIFIDGGAEIVFQLLKEKLIDEFYISIIPVILGDGIRLFKRGVPEQKLSLINSKSYDTGLIQLHYKREL